MRLRQHPIRHIAVALWTGNASGRDLLSGVLQYAQEHRRWNISIIQLPGEPVAHLNSILAAGVDGIITSDCRNEAVARLIRETDAPVVAVEFPFPETETPADRQIDYLTSHNDRIGEVGARHFISSGLYNSYGFVTDIAFERAITPSAREQAFRKTIEAAGLPCHAFSDWQRTKGQGIGLLNKWLLSLPKPAAVMCFYDPLAVRVLNACAHLKLAVPQMVSVLGVDNDILLCETSVPPLSSIDPRHRDIGVQAARHLDAMLHGRRIKDVTRPYSEDQVFVRESTTRLPPSASLVRRARNFIAAHAVEGIGAEDVVSYLGVSRRLAFLRFREVEGRTIRRTIEDERLRLAAKRLRETGWPVARIARTCGYHCLQTFNAAFRRRFRQTPGAYREEGSSK